MTKQTIKEIKNKENHRTNFFKKYKDQIILWIVFAIGVATSCCCRFNWNMAFTAFIFPGCILYFTRKAKACWGLPVAFAGLFLGCSIALFKMFSIEDGVGVAILVDLIATLVTFIPYLLDKLVFTRYFSKHPMLIALLMPLTWITLDIILGFTPLSSYFSIAYSEVYFIQLIGVVNLFGIHFLSFIILFFNTAIVGFFTFKKKNWKTAIAAFSLVAFSLIYSGIYSSVPLISNQTVSVMTAYSTCEYDKDWKRIKLSLDQSKAWLEKDCIKAAEMGSQILVYPEEAFWITEAEENDFNNYSQTISQSKNIYIVLGVHIGSNGEDDNFHRNEAWVYNSKGQRVIQYKKTYFSFPSENIPDGDGKIPVVDTEFGRLAVVICMDLEYPRFISTAGLQNADILIAPSWDWEGMPNNHSAYTSFRAIENGVNFVRCTDEGWTIATDYRGKVISEYYTGLSKEDKKQNHTFYLPTKGIGTLYSYIGQGVEFVFPAGLIAACIASPLIDRKKKLATKAAN